MTNRDELLNRGIEHVKTEGLKRGYVTIDTLKEAGLMKASFDITADEIDMITDMLAECGIKYVSDNF